MFDFEENAQRIIFQAFLQSTQKSFRLMPAWSAIDLIRNLEKGASCLSTVTFLYGFCPTHCS